MKTFERAIILIAAGYISYSSSDEVSNSLDFHPLIPPILGNTLPPMESVPCVCGVFLSGQFVKGSHNPPKGNAALLHEQPEPLPCNPFGNKQCINKCLDLVSITQ
ncbi:hypothetical protein Cfor_08197 [Coptotermes formosanus]|uniref:Uncharacterized protein n=1 Tax=Coptotermes formosanus TaxID=36987 RepID=A0A6L2PSU5_COPFO|nr:hypothetical protein Cfor_08197 [Coptotermes formosanus]